MKIKDDILLEYIKPHISEKVYNLLYDNINEPKEYKVAFKEAEKKTSEDYSIIFHSLTESFYFLKSNLIINLLKMSNIFDSIEVSLITVQGDKLLFKFNVKDLY
jgi:hypothetical protein